MSDTAANPGPPQGDDLRLQAVQRLQRRRDFGRHLLIYALVNAFLVVIWAVSGAGFFWPIFPIVGWGIGVAFNAWDIYQADGPDEERIAREMDRIQREAQPGDA